MWPVAAEEALQGRVARGEEVIRSLEGLDSAWMGAERQDLLLQLFAQVIHIHLWFSHATTNSQSQAVAFLRKVEHRMDQAVTNYPPGESRNLAETIRNRARLPQTIHTER
jgi:hypothetical protein